MRFILSIKWTYLIIYAIKCHKTRNNPQKKRASLLSAAFRYMKVFWRTGVITEDEWHETAVRNWLLAGLGNLGILLFAAI